MIDQSPLVLLLSHRLGGIVVRRQLAAVVLVPGLVGWLTLAGLHAHLYDVTFAIELMVLAVTTSLAVIVWLTARLLDQADAARRSAEEKLRELTVTDELTSLYNRRGFFQLSEAEMNRAVRKRWAVSAVYMDVDGFKNINDAWGHDEGDRALRRVASVLKATLRPTDIVARFGGDEFTVLLVASADEVEKILGRLHRNLESENVLSGALYNLNLTCGYASSEAEGYSLDSLLSAADVYLIARKRARGSLSTRPVAAAEQGRPLPRTASLGRSPMHG
ncbi:MAG TPA: GGDEF domain-containing protein [Thermoanaerobaculia bacterium]|nr:GGDEF domain-containing protein [Thermoanaerobaculia bacterium]